TLIQSINFLRDSSIGVLLLGEGDPVYVKQLRDLIKDLGLEDRIVLGGHVSHSEALGYIQLSDLGVVTFADNPITRLGLPNRLFEFLMFDKPLVVPRLPAIEAFLGPYAQFYRCGNPQDLAGAIL